MPGPAGSSAYGCRFVTSGFRQPREPRRFLSRIKSGTCKKPGTCIKTSYDLKGSVNPMISVLAAGIWEGCQHLGPLLGLQYTVAPTIQDAQNRTMMFTTPSSSSLQNLGRVSASAAEIIVSCLPSYYDAEAGRASRQQSAKRGVEVCGDDMARCRGLYSGIWRCIVFGARHGQPESCNQGISFNLQMLLQRIRYCL